MVIIIFPRVCTSEMVIIIIISQKNPLCLYFQLIQLHYVCISS